MQSIATIHVRQLSTTASEAEVESTTQVMGDAFTGDVFTEMTVGASGAGAKSSLVADLHRAQIKAGLVGGRVYVAEIEGVGIVGAAVSFGPGQELLGSPGQAEAGFNHFMEELGKNNPTMPAWWMSYFLPKYSAFTTEALGDSGFKHNGWQLQLLGVRSEYQRHGVGRALVGFIEAEARATEPALAASMKMSVETETEGALSFYKAVGFVERGKTTISGEEKSQCGASCPMWCLSKDLLSD